MYYCLDRLRGYIDDGNCVWIDMVVDTFTCTTSAGVTTYLAGSCGSKSDLLTSAAINSGEGPWTGVDPSTYCEDVSFSDGICTDTQTGNACNTPWVSPAPAPSPRAVSLIPGWSSETAPLGSSAVADNSGCLAAFMTAGFPFGWYNVDDGICNYLQILGNFFLPVFDNPTLFLFGS